MENCMKELEELGCLKDRLKEINSTTNSTNDKIYTLTNFFDEVLRRDIKESILQYFNYVYDTIKYNFGVTLDNWKKIEKKENSSNVSIVYISDKDPQDFKVINSVLFNLSSTFPNITDEYLAKQVKEISKLSDEARQYFYYALDRTIEKGINKKLINKAYKEALKRLFQQPQDLKDLIPEFNIALAQEYKEKPAGKWFISRKIDGQRCLYINGKLYTRSGKELKIKWLQDLLPAGDFILDGELAYVKNGLEDFRLTESLLHRKEEPPREYKDYKLTYFVFDSLTIEEYYGEQDTPFFKRYQRLQAICKGAEIIEVLEQKELTDIPSIPNGWEGFILRKDTKYKGKRSSDMLKIKQHHDTELLCQDVELTTKRMQNEDKTCIGALICIDPATKAICKVGSGLLDTDRLQDKNKYINKLIKVKYTQKSSNKKGEENYRHPVFICIREQDDL